MRTALFLAIVVFSGTGGELSITRAMKRLGEVKNFAPWAVLGVMGRAFRIGWMWLGISLMALSFFSLLTLLSWNPLSFVIPASALGYAVGVLGAKFLLGERVNATRWLGVFLVCVGVTLTWLGEHGAAPLQYRMAPVAARWLLLGLACAPFAYYLIAIYSAWRFFSEKRRAAPPRNSSPPVSILKPVRGLDREAYENFASFCRLDYPEYEILFGVSETEDPAIPVIERLMADFPERRIRLLVGNGLPGTNNKVSKLCRLAQEARYDLLAVSDSDVRVKPDYLRAVVAPFRDPQVGGVTCMYVGLAERQLAAELEAIGVTSDFFAGVLVARQLEGIRFTLGATMATTRQRLEEIGGFEALVDLHSDDFELGNRIAARGYRVELCPEPVATVYPAQSARAYFEHQLRWARTTRLSRPSGYLGLLFTFGLPWSLAAALVAPSAAVAAGYLATYLVLRLFMGWTVGVWGLRDQLLRRRLWLLPLRDALAFAVWLGSFASNRIQWRGVEFLVDKNRMVAVDSGVTRG